MGEVARHDKATMGFDGVRLTADDGAARSIALLVLAVAIVALAAGLLLEGGPEQSPTPIEDQGVRATTLTSERSASGTAAGIPPEHVARIAAKPPLAPRRMSDEQMMRALQRAEARGSSDVTLSPLATWVKGRDASRSPRRGALATCFDPVRLCHKSVVAKPQGSPESLLPNVNPALPQRSIAAPAIGPIMPSSGCLDDLF